MHDFVSFQTRTEKIHEKANGLMWWNKGMLYYLYPEGFLSQEWYCIKRRSEKFTLRSKWVFYNPYLGPNSDLNLLKQMAGYITSAEERKTRVSIWPEWFCHLRKHTVLFHALCGYCGVKNHQHVVISRFYQSGMEQDIRISTSHMKYIPNLGVLYIVA